MYDEDWLVEAAREDRKAFGMLYDRHVDAIYHYIARRVGDDALAEDLTAAVWERALVAIERYELRGAPFAAWLYRIAGNLIRNHYRRQRIIQMVPFLSHVGYAAPDEHDDDKIAIEAAMNRLPETDREMIALHYYAGLSPAEIADVAGCTPAAVHKRLQRARLRLRQLLEGEVRVTATPA